MFEEAPGLRGDPECGLPIPASGALTLLVGCEGLSSVPSKAAPQAVCSPSTGFVLG